MKSSAFALFLALAAQALPATLQLDQPAAASEGPAAIRVGAGGDLQAAIERARAGDVIELASGASFTGNFVLPAKAGNRYIILRTAPTAGLPDASSRVDPSHSGKLARIQSPNGSPALRTAPGAHHWRLMLLEFGPNATAGGDILALGDGYAGPGRRLGPSRSRRRSLLHPRRSRARPEARHRDEQRVDDRRRLVHLRHQVDEPGRAGDRRLERSRSVPGREQLSRGIRRELHARRIAAGA